MRNPSGQSRGTSRREFLAAGGAALLASGVQAGPAPAQAPPKYLRRNVTDPASAGMVKGYTAAVSAMLKLPPTDPRNWYRNAMIHLIDCPHGNWWLPPWHRGYTGWFEQTCRVLSGDLTFALPYWDWTAEIAIPAAFTADTVLNPSNAAYINGFTNFQNQFNAPVKSFYQGLTADQKKELGLREMATVDEFWAQAKGAFFPSAEARQVDFDKPTRKAVSLPNILTCLAPTTYLDFGSGEVPFHSDPTNDAGMLESGPHNLIHNAVGGFMSDFLSPVDPLFFMHHSNIDRLWDVWTRKQQAQGLPTLPDTAVLPAWQNEPFLFYIDSTGKPVAQNKAGDYATIGAFDYAYQPGSGEQIVKAPPPRPERKLFAATLSKKTLDFQAPPVGTVQAPAEWTNAAANAPAPPTFARIKFQTPEDRRGVRFHVLVNPPEGVRNVDFNDPSFAGTFAFFGSHPRGKAGQPGHKPRTSSFDVPLTETLNRLRAAGRLKEGQPLRIQVVPDTQGVTLMPVQVPLTSISIGTA